MTACVFDWGAHKNRNQRQCFFFRANAIFLKKLRIYSHLCKQTRWKKQDISNSGREKLQVIYWLNSLRNKSENYTEAKYHLFSVMHFHLLSHFSQTNRTRDSLVKARWTGLCASYSEPDRIFDLTPCRWLVWSTTRMLTRWSEGLAVSQIISFSVSTKRAQPLTIDIESHSYSCKSMFSDFRIYLIVCI